MALGRVKHRKPGVYVTGPGARHKGERGAPAPYIHVKPSSKPKRLKFTAEVSRVNARGGSGGYYARMCVGNMRTPGEPGRGSGLIRWGPLRRCSYAHARTPQSAVAKAMKKLSGYVAKRGRKVRS